MAEFDFDRLDVATRYKLMIGAIVPRPIGWISTVDGQGRTNLAPYSFFNAVSSSPPIVMFGPSNKMDGSEKDSLRNAPAGGGRRDGRVRGEHRG
ncbi:MAG: hypothetical protein HC927_09665 [Deltaproteobacteria bacterium]|nr:hypothetical protein [Deltaproteobacteria bacterium]